MTRWFVLLTLILAPLSAGCIAGDEGAVDAASSDASGDDATTPAGQRDMESTPATEPDAAAQDGGEPSSAEPATFVARPVDWTGKIGTAYCAPMGPNACMRQSLTDGESWTMLGVGTIGGGQLVLTWEASSVATEKLQFLVFSGESCGERCFSGTDAYSAEVEGTSPLTLSLDAATLPEGQSLLIDVGVPRMTPSPVYAYATLEQPFQVQGELLLPG